MLPRAARPTFSSARYAASTRGVRRCALRSNDIVADQPGCAMTHRPSTSFSPREFEILRMILEAKPTERDCKRHSTLSPKDGGENYHYEIKSKLGVRSDIELVYLCMRPGLGRPRSGAGPGVARRQRRNFSVTSWRFSRAPRRRTRMMVIAEPDVSGITVVGRVPQQRCRQLREFDGRAG